MIFFIAIVVFIALLIDLFMKQENFGQLPKGERLLKIENKATYRNKKFENQHPTPVMAEGVSYPKMLREVLFKRSPRSKPKQALPSIKVNLKELLIQENILIWFGHSSYFIQADGKRFLIDPVFSGAASPVSFTTNSFAGSDVYRADDMPEIDYLIITHDHWDHLDYKTMKALHSKVNKVITSLGVGAHLELWGFKKEQIIESYWGESAELAEGFSIHCRPARHFSGRGFKRAQSLWSSFVLLTPRFKLYLGGDSGYDKHFKEIGEQFGPFDLAVLECGQYNLYWKYIHMLPEETVQAAIDLKANAFIPVHWGKFVLALHDWDEPIQRVTAEAVRLNVPVLTPMIGEKVKLNGLNNTFSQWWTTPGL